MQAFVDATLRRIPDLRSNSDIEWLLGHVAEHLGCDGAYIFEFTAGGAIRLWDSNPGRAAWWHHYTAFGRNSSVRTRTERLSRHSVHQIEVPPSDPLYEFAQEHGFVRSTVVPVTFDAQTRGVVGYAGAMDSGGETYTSLQVVSYALLMQAVSLEDEKPQPVVLTPREREVMELAAQGLTSEMVASRLGMSPRTVNQHIDNASQKLNAKNRVHAVAEAMRRGLIL